MTIQEQTAKIELALEAVGETMIQLYRIGDDRYFGWL